MDLILEPGHAEKNYWRDLWRYRELFYMLAWRDITVRYKQTVIGVAWAVIRPLLDHDCIHRFVQQGRQNARAGCCSLRAARHGGEPALAVLCHGHG